MMPFIENAVSKGLHPYEQTNSGNTPAHFAASTNNTLALKYFFTKFQFPVDLVNKYVK